MKSESEPKKRRVPISSWIVAALATPASIFGIVASFMNPGSLPLRIQMIIGVLLVAYIWWLIYRTWSRKR